MARLSSSGRKRIYLIDELRGLCVLCMIVYHGLYTLSFMFGLEFAEKALIFFSPAQPFFAGLFVFISGISSKLTHSNIKRGIKLLIASIILSLVTIVIFPMFSLYGCDIYFGILHLLSASILIYSASYRLFNKIVPILGIIIFLMLFFFTYKVPSGYLGVSGVGMTLPQKLYSTDFLFFLGFPNADFFSADYFPLLPWFFMFITGTYVGEWAKKGRFPSFAYKPCIVPLQWFGRHALLVYVLHQPIIYAAAWLVLYVKNLF